jgi:hypothetical protein
MNPSSLVSNWFADRPAVLATMHRKEQIIAPLLETIGIQIFVPPDFNTDRFGTFTRDVKRLGDQQEAARLKAEKAMAMMGMTLAIASEGSFAPHPAFPYVACDRELVLLIDQEHNLELIGQAISMETNYSHQRISSYAEAEIFAAKAGFPAHGLLVIANPGEDLSTVKPGQIVTGIVTEVQLQEALAWAFAQARTAHIETDMRALYNPTRMKVIAQATQDLIQVISQICPDCGCPGFQVVEQNSGLCCSLCNSPTTLIRSVIYRCQKCDCCQEKMFPHGEAADPAQCHYCNP